MRYSSDAVSISSSEIEIVGKRIAAQLSKLSVETQNDFLNLTRKQNVPTNTTYGDAFAIFLNNSIAGHLFLDLSLINHSCLPNTMWRMTSEQSQQEIEELRAIREIKAGEEITAPYLDLFTAFLQNKQEKLDGLLKNWNFLCECPKCVNSEEDSLKNLRSELQELMKKRDLLILKDPSKEKIKIQKKITLLTNQIVDGIIKLDEPSVFLTSWLHFKMLCLSGYWSGRSDLFEKGMKLFKDCVETGKFTEALTTFKKWKESMNFK